MILQVNKEILSFAELPELAENSQNMVILLRHSYRESLQDGSIDPGLTAEGRAYAAECGKLLKGMRDLCYGSSPRRRTVETVQHLISGGSLGEGEITLYPEIADTSLFAQPEVLEEIINNGTISDLLKKYFMTGQAEYLISLPLYNQKLVNFLTGTVFPKKNIIMCTHDVVAVSLMLPLQVYPFDLSDWCGNVQGAVLYRRADNDWTIAYVVPDKNTRKKYSLFI